MQSGLTVLVFGVALGIRLIYFLQASKTPIAYGLAADSGKYEQIARQLIDGSFSNSDFLFLNPLYPCFLSLIYRIAGQQTMAVMAVQALVDTATCMLVYYCGRVIYGHLAALVGAALYALYGFAIFYTGLVLAPTLVIFFLIGAVALLLWADARQRGLSFFCAGFSLGLAACCAPAVISTLPAMLCWIFFCRNRHNVGLHKACMHGSLLTAGALSLLLIFTVRNSLLQKSLTPFSVLGGINFYLGNNPHATGLFMPLPGVASMPGEHIRTSILLAEKNTGRRFTASEASSYWMREGLRFLRNNPKQAVALYYRKLRLFWHSREIPTNIDYRFCRSLVPVLRLPLVSFGLLAPCGIVGLLLCIRCRKSILLALLTCMIMLSVILFFVAERYRLPIVPLLSVAAGGGFVRIIPLLRSAKFMHVAAVCSMLALCTLIVHGNIPWLPEQKFPEQYLNLARAYLRMQDTEKAIEAVKTALAIQPNAAGGYHFLGIIAEREGRQEEARKNYEKAVALDGDFLPARLSLASTLEHLGDPKQALVQYREAQRLNPLDANAHFGAGMTAGALGMTDDAIEAFKQVISVTGNARTAALAHTNLCISYIKKGDRANALWHYQQAQKLGAPQQPHIVTMLKPSR